MQQLSMQALNRLSVEEFKATDKVPIVLVLDNVRSLHNVGAIFRTADAFGLQALYLCGITATPPNKEIYKTALGATESVEWRYFATTIEALQHLRTQQYHIIAVEQTDRSQQLQHYPAQAQQAYALVLGNEVYGVAPDVLQLCHEAIEVPQRGTKHSLNVSVCAGVVAWHFLASFEAAVASGDVKNG